MRTTSQQRIDEYTAKGWWSDRTFNDLFEEAVRTQPTRTAVIDPPNRADLAFGAPQRPTFSEAATIANDIARALYSAGVRQGDSVLVQLPNIIELPLMYAACAKLGAIISPVPMQYGRHELEGIAKSLKPTAYVSVTRFKGANIAEAHRAGLPERVIPLAFGPDAKAPIRSIDTLIADRTNDDEFKKYVTGLKHSGNDIFTICWTSGTTGKPKGVPRSHNHWFSQMFGVQDSIGFSDRHVLLNPFPLVNMAAISGFLYPWLFNRSTLVLHHPFDLPLMLKQIQDEGVIYTIAPPAALNLLIAQPELLKKFDLSKLRTIASGSAPLSPWMVKGFKDLMNIDVVNAFGSNEGIALVSNYEEVPDPEHRALYFPRFGVTGLTFRNRISERMITKLIDPDSGAEITERNKPGELCIKGPNVFDGYLDSPEDNAKVFDADGFFRTGDMLEIVGDTDPPRFYRFVGRSKDIIIRGGMKISPEELDNILVMHPKVKEIAVFGSTDRIMGERVACAAAVKPDMSLTLEDLTAFLKEKDVAIFKWPERLVILDALPRNPLGKVLRHELRKSHDVPS